MYLHCENCTCFKQDDSERYPNCKSEGKIRPCEKERNEFFQDLLMEQQEQM